MEIMVKIKIPAQTRPYINPEIDYSETARNPIKRHKVNSLA